MPYPYDLSEFTLKLKWSPDSPMPYRWHGLICELERFKVETGRGLAHVWKLVNEERYDAAVLEFEAAIGRWKEDVVNWRVRKELGS